MNANGTELNDTATPTVMGEAVEHADTVPSNTGGQASRWLPLGAWWRFARHLLEMVVAMIAGMAVLGITLWALGEPPGYANPLVEHGLMGASMSAPMVAWMRHRGHTWSDSLEMTLAMLVPIFALVLPVELGVVGLTGHSLTMLSHAAMIVGMAALMIYRWDRYAHGAHDRRA